MSYEYVSVDGQSRKKSRTSRGNGAQTKATLLEHLECIDSVERPQIGIHVPSLDRVARHNDPWNCDSPLSSRCDSV